MKRGTSGDGQSTLTVVSIAFLHSQKPVRSLLYESLMAPLCRAFHPAASMETEVETLMTDLLMLAFTIAFFAVALLYVAACEKLR